MINNTNVAIKNLTNIEESFILKLTSGDFGLAKTFYLYMCLIGLVLSISMLISPIVSMESLVLFMLLAYVVYATPLYIGMWRASNRHKGLKIWPILAKLNVKLNIFVLVIAILLQVGFAYVDGYLSVF